MLPGPPGPGVEERGELDVYVVEVAHRMLVQDHDVRAQALEPPVLLGLEDLPDEGDVASLDHAHEEDGEIAGDPVGPQPRLAQHVALQDLRPRPQRGVGV